MIAPDGWNGGGGGRGSKVPGHRGLAGSGFVLGNDADGEEPHVGGHAGQFVTEIAFHPLGCERAGRVDHQFGTVQREAGRFGKPHAVAGGADASGQSAFDGRAARSLGGEGDVRRCLEFGGLYGGGRHGSVGPVSEGARRSDDRDAATMEIACADGE